MAAAGFVELGCIRLSGMGPPGRARVVGTESAGGVPGAPAWVGAWPDAPLVIEPCGARTIGCSGTAFAPGCADIPGSELPAVAVAVAVAAIVGDWDIAGIAVSCGPGGSDSVPPTDPGGPPSEAGGVD